MAKQNSGLAKDDEGIVGQISRFMAGIEMVITSLLITTILGVLTAQVLARYVFNTPFRWSDEAARFALIWLTFLAAGLVSFDDEHVAVLLFEKRIGPRVRRALKVIANVVPVALGLVWIYTGLDPVRRGMGAASTAMGIPMAYVYGATIIGFGLVVLHSAANIITLMRLEQGVAAEQVPGSTKT